MKNFIFFLHFSIDNLVPCCPEKANLMQNFCSWYLIEFQGGAATL